MYVQSLQKELSSLYCPTSRVSLRMQRSLAVTHGTAIEACYKVSQLCVARLTAQYAFVFQMFEEISNARIISLKRTKNVFLKNYPCFLSQVAIVN